MYGVPGRTRTCDPQFRKLLLYPPELRGRGRYGRKLISCRAACAKQHGVGGPANRSGLNTTGNVGPTSPSRDRQRAAGQGIGGAPRISLQSAVACHGTREIYRSRQGVCAVGAESMALRRGHQRLTPEHLFKVLLEDSEGLCANLIRAAGGDPKAALQAVDAELDKLPKVEGSGAGQVYMSPELARVFDQAEQLAQKRRRQLCHGRAAAAGARGSRGHRCGQGARRRPGRRAEPQPGDRGGAQGQEGRQRLGRGRLRRA